MTDADKLRKLAQWFDYKYQDAGINDDVQQDLRRIAERLDTFDSSLRCRIGTQLMRLKYWGTLVVVECCKCGMAFGMSKRFYERCRETHDWFYCPAGHEQYFPGKSEAEKLRERLEREQAETRRLQAERTRERQAHMATKRSLSATQGVITKIKKRVYNGTCPQCRRHFQNLERHMQHVHPEYCGAEDSK